MNHVNSGSNYARFLISDKNSKNLSFKVTGGSFNATLNFFTFDLAENKFVDTVKLPNYNTFVSVPQDTKVHIWMWRSDGSGGYSTTTTTTYNTSTTTTFNTTTTYTTTKSTTTTFETSKSTQESRNTTESRSTEENRNTLKTTVTQYSTTTFYNTFRSTFTGGGGCARGCI
jgi:hypothetical protein|tara:strand:+ start:2160 stop:2672 length:513 start_codon:yes stop_codon:yes gene_type:complete